MVTHTSRKMGPGSLGSFPVWGATKWHHYDIIAHPTSKHTALKNTSQWVSRLCWGGFLGFVLFWVFFVFFVFLGGGWLQSKTLRKQLIIFVSNSLSDLDEDDGDDNPDFCCHHLHLTARISLTKQRENTSMFHIMSNNFSWTDTSGVFICLSHCIIIIIIIIVTSDIEVRHMARPLASFGSMRRISPIFNSVLPYCVGHSN